MSIFYIFYNHHYHYQGQGIRLVSSNILIGPFRYWVTLYISGCESRQELQASDIARNFSWVFNYLIYVIERLCHLGNEFTGFTGVTR